MLIAPLHAEGAEDQDKNKNVIHAHGLLDDVSGKKLKSFFAAVDVKNPQVECNRNADPEHAPERSLADGHFMGAAIEYAEVEHEQDENACVEKNPEGWSAHASSVVCELKY